MKEPKERFSLAIDALKQRKFRELAGDINDYVTYLKHNYSAKSPEQNNIWDYIVYDMGDYKLGNIIGPACVYDQLKNTYSTYAIKTEDKKEDLAKAATTAIKNMVEAYSLIKPEGEEPKARDVYIVWRQFPEIWEGTKEMVDKGFIDKVSRHISWRMNIYAGSPYFKDGNLLLCTESE